MKTAGHPRSFTSVKQLQDGIDGIITYAGEKLQNKDFRRESDLEAYLVNNIRLFCNHLGDEYVSHTANAPIRKTYWIGPRGRRVDLVIECKNKTYIVELKNPSSGTECRAAIGQILDYGREFTDTEKKELLIISSRFDMHTARTIKYYNLPIRYFYISKAQTMEFLDEGNYRQAA